MSSVLRLPWPGFPWSTSRVSFCCVSSGVERLMIASRNRVKIGACCLVMAVCAGTAGLVGCQPEGTGSIKGPATRPDDGSLGRPLGNAPEIPKKKPATESTKKAAPEAANPRL